MERRNDLSLEVTNPTHRHSLGNLGREWVGSVRGVFGLSDL